VLRFLVNAFNNLRERASNFARCSRYNDLVQKGRWHMTTQDMEQLISEVNGTLAIEGMPLDETDRDNLRSILRGEVSYQEMKQRILKEYHRETVAYG
jgi:hypothetical protein